MLLDSQRGLNPAMGYVEVQRMTRLSDYLIEQTGLVWPQLLASWAWLLPADFTVWIVNTFGDLFIVLEDGSVHMLDVGRGTIERLADGRDAFATRLDQDDNANNWLMIPLVDGLRAANLVPGTQECYSYIRLPILGGEYSVANTRVLPMATHYAALGPIHEKLKDVPDGHLVRFDIASPEADRRRTKL